MIQTFLKSKLHRASVTEANLNYVGSITIDSDLLDKSGILEYEKVQVVNVNNGCRFETYVIKGQAKSGVICINGPAARLAVEGDIVIIISYCYLASTDIKKYKPTVVYLDKENKILELSDKKK